VKRVLVANRGEIALRIIRGAREEDLEAVAVYSDADANSPHVLAANHSVHIGGSAPAESYLRIQGLIDAAKSSGCDAVHPGYGFLSERSEFAKAVIDAGLTWIGPPPAAIASMGDKTAARKKMRDTGVPVVPGTVEPMRTAGDASKAARTIGYPLLLKAAAGGGGRGMRVVRSESELEGAFASAKSEAEKAFGDGRVYLERYLEGPRHIEIQLLADQHGRVTSLGERECSIQRRHQKLIEEAPSLAVTPAIRRSMSEAAVRAAQAVRYQSAGTVEFLLMPNGDFYFLEMNTRLQVEHPVTEMVTGIDIVKEQIRVAAGEKLSFRQEDVRQTGHAIECRIYAEDPDSNFLPCPGVITSLRVPGGPGVRDDSGVYAGFEIPIYYDPIISKLVAWGKDRTEAIARMKRALGVYVVTGVKTTVPFHIRVMNNRHFIEGNFDTNFIEQVFFKEEEGRKLANEEVALVTAAIQVFTEERKRSVAQQPGEAAGPVSMWKYSTRPGIRKIG